MGQGPDSLDRLGTYSVSKRPVEGLRPSPFGFLRRPEKSTILGLIPFGPLGFWYQSVRTEKPENTSTG